MDRDLAELVARSLDAPVELLPALPDLLSDLDELGARVHEVVPMLRAAGVGPRSRMLDLGCGKGAVAIAAARELGVQVRGVDAMPAFVAHAESAAARAGVSSQCAFEIGDVRDVASTVRELDLVSMLALGDVLGDLGQTVATLRGCVRPGGLVLIDDAFLADDAPAAVRDSVHCLDHATSLRVLTNLGDELVAEAIIDGPQTAADYGAMTAKIERRAEELARTHESLAELMRDYAVRQSKEVELLTGPVVGVLWLLRRRDVAPALRGER